jgi:hypothetical protein
MGEDPLLPPNWKELEPLLDELLDVPVAERVARIAELSWGSLTRQRALEQLLADAERDTPLLDDSAARRFDELAIDPSTAPPEVLAGRYRTGKGAGPRRDGDGVSGP